MSWPAYLLAGQYHGVVLPHLGDGRPGGLHVLAVPGGGEVRRASGGGKQMLEELWKTYKNHLSFGCCPKKGGGVPTGIL